MKKAFRFLGLIAIALFAISTFAACDNGSSSTSAGTETWLKWPAEFLYEDDSEYEKSGWWDADLGEDYYEHAPVITLIFSQQTFEHYSPPPKLSAAIVPGMHGAFVLSSMEGKKIKVKRYVSDEEEYVFCTDYTIDSDYKGSGLKAIAFSGGYVNATYVEDDVFTGNDPDGYPVWFVQFGYVDH